MRGSHRIGALEIAERIYEHTGSHVDATFLEFIAVEGEIVRCWYMNSGGKGPSFEITLTYRSQGWELDLHEHPPGTQQPYEIA